MHLKHPRFLSKVRHVVPGALTKSAIELFKSFLIFSHKGIGHIGSSAAKLDIATPPAPAPAGNPKFKISLLDKLNSFICSA